MKRCAIKCALGWAHGLAQLSLGVGENKIHNKHTSVHVQMEHFLFRKGAWGAHSMHAHMFI